jgi:hypothetical protein
MIRKLSVLLMLFTASLAAQNPPRDPVKTDLLRGSATVSGIVVDADNKPMRQVEVHLEGDPRASRAVITRDDGRFVFSNVSAGEFALRATKAGYPDANHGAKKSGRPGAKLQLRDADRVTDVVLHMERGAVLTGTVFDDRGQPLPGASVTAFQTFTALDGSITLRAVVRSGSSFPNTDDRGVFRFFGLPAGDYIVGLSPFFRGMGDAARVPSDDEIRDAFARATGPMQFGGAAPKVTPTIDRPRMNYTAVFFPGVTNPLDAARIHVSAGEVRSGLDLHAVLRPNATISGVIAGYDGPDRPEVILAMPAAAGLGTTRYSLSQPDRTFSLANLTPGEYVIYARTRIAPVLMDSQPVIVTTGDVAGITLRLAPPSSIDGQLVFDAAAPPASLQAFAASLYPTSSTSYGPLPNGAPAGADGRFKIDGITQSRAWIGVRVPAGKSRTEPAWMVSSIMLGDRDVTDLPLDFQAGQALPKLTVTVTDKISSLSGRILRADGSPASDVFVIAVPADPQYWVWSSRRIKSARPDADGNYVFPGLPAGEYKVAVTTDLEQNDLQDRSFLEQIASVAADVTVAAAEKKMFDLKMGGLTPPPTQGRRRPR